MKSNIETLVDSHLAAYCDTDDASRLAALQKAWHPEGRLVDPPLESRGHRGMSEQAAALLAQFPGHTFVRTTGVDLHHEFARYGWALRSPAGAAVLEGVDFMTLDVDGRIMKIVGFFGRQETRA